MKDRPSSPPPPGPRTVFVLRLWATAAGPRGELENVTTAERIRITSAAELQRVLNEAWAQQTHPSTPKSGRPGLR